MGDAAIMDDPGNQLALTRLQKHCWVYIILSMVFMSLGGLWLAQVWQVGYAQIWIALTAGVLAYQAWLLRTSLRENHRLGEIRLFSGLGWGNIASLARGVMFAGLTGFLLLPIPPDKLSWIPAGLYTVGALIDYLDGYFARITNQVTRLGEILDMSLDGWGLLVASILAVRYGQVPGWYILAGAARYLYLAGLGFRKRMGWAVTELPPNAARRPFAGLQMGFAFTMLWPIFRPPGTFHAAAIFTLPFLVNFLLDWLVVSQTLDAHRLVSWRGLKRFAVRWLPLGLRLAVFASVALPLAGWWPGLQADAGRGLPPTVGIIVMALEYIVVALILVGAAGRIAAIAGMIALGIHQFYTPLSGLQLMLIYGYGAILYLGTGVYSAWKPEDRLIYRRAGEKPA